MRSSWIFSAAAMTPGIFMTSCVHGLGMDHGDMEALGFQLRDYYEEVE